MTISNNNIIAASKKLIKTISLLSTKISSPIIIAVDGGSGAGKSTFAKIIADRLNAIVIPLDDFFAADIPDLKWDEFSTEEKLEKIFNWERLRKSVIEPLLLHNSASWRTFDFESGIQTDGIYKTKSGFVTRDPADIVIIDGTYSSSSKIADLINITVLIDVPVRERHDRLIKREEATFLKQWHQRWDAVEDYFFTHMRPKKYFDIVIELN